MLTRIVIKYGLIGGFFIAFFAFLKSEWFSTGLFPDLFITIIAVVFVGLGILLKQSIKNKSHNVQIVNKTDFQLKLEQLSRREIEVLELLYSKYANKEIANQLHIELSTLKTHINSIYKKMRITNRRELMWMADSENIFKNMITKTLD